MISNQITPFLYRGVDDEDNLTVQVSNANSQLGTHLLEGEWDEALDHLDTAEGERDSTERNDPLGLFNDGSKLIVPNSKNSAIFASLYVRAPFQVIKKICDRAKDAELSDLMYALSVIPHEEQLRLQELQRKIPYRSRCWTKEEFNEILKLLLKECLPHQSSTAAPSLLEKCPSWIINPSAFAVTPLAMAAYNPDVSSSILQILCTMEPRAIDDMDCKLFAVTTIPLIIAAASPAPPEGPFSLEHVNEVRRNRWGKVELLMNKDWFYEQQKSGHVPLDNLPSPPELTLQQVKIACDEAVKREEWELVRELLKQNNSMTGEESTMMRHFQTELSQHDNKERKKLKKQQEKRSRDEWLHRNMGLIMYPVDIFMDLIYSVIPHPHKNKSLVSALS